MASAYTIVDPHLMAQVRSQVTQYVVNFSQQALWLQRITENTPGATNTPAWDPLRQQTVATSDGSYGVGWQVTQNTIVRGGYLAPVTVMVGIEDRARLEEYQEGGLTFYEGPAVHFLPTLVQTPDPLQAAIFQKGDVLIEVLLPALTYGRRWVIGDLVSPQTLYGTLMISSAKLEYRDPAEDALVYSIPTT